MYNDGAEDQVKGNEVKMNGALFEASEMQLASNRLLCIM